MDAGDLTGALERAREPGPPRLELLGGAEPGAPERVGLVSGSFDPMTVAHAALTQAVSADLTLLLYSPATLPKKPEPGGAPHPALLTPEERLASLVAFCERRSATHVAVCSHGLYADQAQAAARRFPGAELTFGVGSDKVIQLFEPSWYEDRDAALDRLFSVARLAYAMRAGDESDVEAALGSAARWSDRVRQIRLAPEVAGLSSQGVREAIRRGEDPSAWVPPEVLPFVRAAAGP